MTPTLKTARLILHPPKDVAPYVKWLNDAAVVQFSDQRFLKHTENSQQIYLRSFDGNASHLWEISLGGKPIGSISVAICWPHKRAEIGIMIGDKSEWRKGFGAEAWKAVMDWLISVDIEKVEGGCHPLNVGMIILFGKVGMSMEAHVHDHFLSHTGIREPMMLFGRLL
jgi:[ribosomal protein S5]-alanine N-acetyltransferase